MLQVNISPVTADKLQITYHAQQVKWSWTWSPVFCEDSRTVSIW